MLKSLFKELGSCRRLRSCNVENVAKKKPDDYVISTGKQYTVKNFIHLVAKKLGMKILWTEKELNEKCIWNNKVIIKIDKKYLDQQSGIIKRELKKRLKF